MAARAGFTTVGCGCGCGPLESGLLDDSAELRQVLHAQLRLRDEDGEPMELAIDGIVLDRNRDGSLLVSELAQGLCERLADPES